MALQKEIKLGIFVFSGILFFLLLILRIGNFSFGKSYVFFVEFSDVSGLPIKSSIKMYGVDIGKISDMKLENGLVRVAVEVKKDIKIFKNAKITIASSGMIGAKNLNITGGDNSQGFIEKGDVVRGFDPVSIDKIIEKVSNIFNEIAPDGNMKNMSLVKTLKNLEEITHKLNEGLGKNSSDIRQIVVSIRDAANSINVLSSDLKDLVHNNKEGLQQDVDKIGEILEKISTAGDKINTFMETLNTGKGTIPTLVNDEKMAYELKETFTKVKDVSTDLKNFTNRIKKIDIYWDAELEHNFDDDLTRTNAGITFEPRDDKRYIFKFNNLVADSIGKFDKGDQKYNSFTALIEKDFNKFRLHAGMVKSYGGVGGEYRAFENFGIGTEVYRFTRENKSGDKIPWIDAYAYYNFVKWARLKVGVSDIAEKPSMTAGVDISIRDDDISYLLGFVGLATTK